MHTEEVYAKNTGGQDRPPVFYLNIAISIPKGSVLTLLFAESIIIITTRAK